MPRLLGLLKGNVLRWKIAGNVQMLLGSGHGRSVWGVHGLRICYLISDGINETELYFIEFPGCTSHQALLIK